MSSLLSLLADHSMAAAAVALAIARIVAKALGPRLRAALDAHPELAHLFNAVAALVPVPDAIRAADLILSALLRRPVRLEPVVAQSDKVIDALAPAAPVLRIAPDATKLGHREP